MRYANIFDGVFTNAVLHWIPEKDQVIVSIKKALKKGGKLVAEFGGKGNVDGILFSLKKILEQKGYFEQAALKLWYFPSLGEYAARLEKQGFRIIFAVHFDRETILEDQDNGIKNWLEMFGKPFFYQIPQTEKVEILEQLKAEMKPKHFRGEHWWLDYKRLRVVAIKE
ncbi:MAG: methyltransferase domain-containing protein [Chitinophagaceae bacterium]